MKVGAGKIAPRQPIARRRYGIRHRPASELPGAEIARILNIRSTRDMVKDWQTVCQELGITTKGRTPVAVWERGRQRFAELNRDMNDALNPSAGVPADLEFRKAVLDQWCRKRGNVAGQPTQPVAAVDNSGSQTQMSVDEWARVRRALYQHLAAINFDYDAAGRAGQKVVRNAWVRADPRTQQFLSDPTLTAAKLQRRKLQLWRNFRETMQNWRDSRAATGRTRGEGSQKHPAANTSMLPASDLPAEAPAAAVPTTIAAQHAFSLDPRLVRADVQMEPASFQPIPAADLNPASAGTPTSPSNHFHDQGATPYPDPSEMQASFSHPYFRHAPAPVDEEMMDFRETDAASMDI